MAEEKTEVLEAALKEAVDLENIPIEEISENLRCSKKGLTSEGAQERLTIFGPNKLEEKRESKFLKFLGFIGIHFHGLWKLLLLWQLHLPMEGESHQIGKILLELLLCW